MPHPKNNLKLTGDTHLPDADDLVMLEEDRAASAAAAAEPMQRTASAPRQAFQSQSQSDEFTASGQSRWLDRLPYADQARGYVSQARGRVGEQPLAALGIAVALGFIAAKLLRR